MSSINEKWIRAGRLLGIPMAKEKWGHRLMEGNLEDTHSTRLFLPVAGSLRIK